MKSIGVAFVVLIALLLVFDLAEGFKRGEKGKTKRLEEQRKEAVKTSQSEEVKVEVLQRERDIHAQGTIRDEGRVFDASRERGNPLTFRLGAGMVIQGLERGMPGMCEGEIRRLTIPSHFGYGETGYPPIIPPSATLVFEIELLEISSEPPPVPEQDVPHLQEEDLAINVGEAQ